VTWDWQIDMNDGVGPKVPGMGFWDSFLAEVVGVPKYRVRHLAWMCGRAFDGQPALAPASPGPAEFSGQERLPLLVGLLPQIGRDWWSRAYARTWSRVEGARNVRVTLRGRDVNVEMHLVDVRGMG
jgi:hypothetical protein